MEPSHLTIGPPVRRGDIVFLVQAGYHLDDAIATARALEPSGHRVTMVAPRPPDDVLRGLRPSTARFRETTTRATAAGLGVGAPVDQADLATMASTLVVRNDWGPSRTLVDLTRASGTPVVGWVEGVQDFDDVDTGRSRNVYGAVDQIFTLGTYDRERLTGRCAAIHSVGSERLWRRWHGPPTKASRPLLANVNFTYGVQSNARRGWVADVMGTARTLGIDIAVSVHPADRGWRGRTRRVHGGIDVHLEDSARLVSRFSTAVYDALVLGVDVVYYNPHGETVPTFSEPAGAFAIATDRASLADVLRDAPPPPEVVRQHASSFLHHHLVLDGAPPSARAARLLADLVT